MWPTHRLLDLLKVEHPILLAPMAQHGTVELAASVCNAGGFGALACALLAPDAVAGAVGALRAATDKPFGLNFFCQAPAAPDSDKELAWRGRMLPYYREYGIAFDPAAPRRQAGTFDETLCALVEDLRPAATSFHFGLPSPALVERIKASGALVMSSATTVEEAVWLEQHGADIVIAQGAEAGGHRATFLAANPNDALPGQMGTIALVPQIVDAVRLPVVAAGGIADARGVAAAFALGASAVQIGTAYLHCPEAAVSPLYRDALRNARGGSAVLTNVFTGRPARALANRLVREIGPIAASAPGFPRAMHAIAPLVTEAQRRGSVDFAPLWAGEAFPLAQAMPASALTERLIGETRQRFEDLAVGNR